MMPDIDYISNPVRNALIVHPNAAILSEMQAVGAQEGYNLVLCRDFSAALSAMAQHRFDLCIASAGILAAGDGWSLAGVLRMCFPNAYIAMIAAEPDLLMLQNAINSGVTQLYLSSKPAAKLASEIFADCCACLRKVEAAIAA